MGERRFWTGRAAPKAYARYGAFSRVSGGNFESLTVWLVLCEFSTDSLQSWRLDSSNTLLFEVAIPTVFFCYNRAIPGHS